MMNPPIPPVPPPDVTRTRDGWYPRWWLLSALFCIFLATCGYFLWFYMPCSTGIAIVDNILGWFCRWSILSWPGWLQIGAIWLIFGIGWLVALVFGYRPLESPGHRRGPTALFFRSLSNFAAIRGLLIFYGGVTFFVLLVVVLARRAQPIPFALQAIVIFVGACTLFYRRPQPTRPRQTAQANWLARINQADSPLGILRTLWFMRILGFFFRNRGGGPNANNPANQQMPPGQPVQAQAGQQGQGQQVPPVAAGQGQGPAAQGQPAPPVPPGAQGQGQQGP